MKALLWRLFGIELFAFFSLATLLPRNSLRYIGFPYFRFLVDQKESKSSKPPRLYQSPQQPQQAFENVYPALCFCSQGNLCILSMFAIFNPVDRKMATIVRNRAKKAPGKDIDKRVHSLRSRYRPLIFVWGDQEGVSWFFGNHCWFALGVVWDRAVSFQSFV